uniref:Uncharacterized protein n=1 Tax=Anguilla anguilla TaxID=7936 RepID=A0A0E9T7D4_ANGAN
MHARAIVINMCVEFHVS